MAGGVFERDATDPQYAAACVCVCECRSTCILSCVAKIVNNFELVCSMLVKLQISFPSPGVFKDS